MSKQPDSNEYSKGTSDTTDSEPKERVIRKTYTLTKKDLDSIEVVKDKCLNHKVVLSDSHVIRLALAFVAKLPDQTLIDTSAQVPKVLMGRPKTK